MIHAPAAAITIRKFISSDQFHAARSPRGATYQPPASVETAGSVVVRPVLTPADLRAGVGKLAEHLNGSIEQAARSGKGTKGGQSGHSARGGNEKRAMPCYATRCQDRDSNPDSLAGKGF